MNWLITQNFKRLFTHIECCALRTMKKEIWKPIKDIEDYAHVSSEGNIKILERYVSNGKGLKKVKERVYKGRKTKGMYMAEICIDSKIHSYSVARLVYNTFNNTSLTNHYQILHKDGDLSNNRLINLKVISKRENNRHSNTGVQGVHKRKNGFYVVHISFEHVNILLHTSKNLEECHKIYQAAKLKTDEFYKLKNNILNQIDIKNKIITKKVDLIN